MKIKGKIKEKKFISILVVPHSSDNIKALKFKALYSKFAITISLALISIICVSIFIIHTLNENKKMKLSVSILTESNLEQKELIEDKSSEIKNLKLDEEQKGEQIKEFLDKYKELSENYVNQSLQNQKSSRGELTSSRSFVTELKSLKTILDNLNATTSSEKASTDILLETEDKIKKYMDTIPTLWPTSGNISSPFGYRKDPTASNQEYHSGIDISAPYGQDIVSAATGIVTFSGYTDGYGYEVIIDHGHGISTLYAHSSKLLVQKGTSVNKGNLIAKVGSTGKSTGPHLHFAVIFNGTNIDPLKYLDN